jgi:hypothetical protein
VPSQQRGSQIVSAIENNVRYARVHEYGFDGDVEVQSFTRRQASRNVGRGKKMKAQGVAFVHSFMRHMNIPARAPVRKGMAERLPIYVSSLSRVVTRTFRDLR